MALRLRIDAKLTDDDADFAGWIEAEAHLLGLSPSAYVMLVARGVMLARQGDMRLASLWGGDVSHQEPSALAPPPKSSPAAPAVGRADRLLGDL